MNFSTKTDKPMNENKTYSLNEIRRIREACRVYGVESFSLDLLCEGLNIDEVKRRLATIDDELTKQRQQGRRAYQSDKGFCAPAPRCRSSSPAV
jgi:hypothetical protein